MKFSQIAINNSPAISDYAVGVSSGNVDQRSTWGSVAALISANLSASSVTLTNLNLATMLQNAGYTESDQNGAGFTQNVRAVVPGHQKTMTCYGGDIVVLSNVGLVYNASGTLTAQVEVDGVAQNEIWRVSGQNLVGGTGFFVIHGVSAGSHVIRVTAINSGGAAQLTQFYSMSFAVFELMSRSTI